MATFETDKKLLKISGLSAAYEKSLVVSDVSIDLNQVEIGSIVGPSGCGKSTLLRCIAGFEQPQKGTITMNGQVIANPQWSVAPEQRGIGMVFQDVTLFPHLSIAKNIAFGLRKWNKQNIKERVSELLNMIGLDNYGDRHPSSLSGGEQQRVALARAMAPKPKLLLMDEAFSSLDHERRQSLVPEVRNILKTEKMSAILVTHDHNEAFAIADRVGVMQNGNIHQWDTPYNLYHHPCNKFTARYIGEGTFIFAKVIDDSTVESVFGTHRATNFHKLPSAKDGHMLVRPDDILHDDDSPLQAKVVKKSFRGSHFLYRVRLENGEHADCLADSHHNHSIGERIGIRPNIEHLVIFGDE